MKIAVVGTGYVGLVTGTCLAESGNDVVCIDVDQEKIVRLQRGEIPIYEPGLAELVERNQRVGRLQFVTDLAAAVRASQLVFVAVGTPPAADGSADLTNLWQVVGQIAPHLPPEAIVITKSTVPVGTNARIAAQLRELTGRDCEVASNPEFLKEGAAIDDFMRPDRVVVGVRRPEVGETLRSLYAPFLRTEKPFLVMSPESAEMTKYVANALLATKISFINEVASLCERMAADVDDVRRGIGHDRRIGFSFLFPGVGYGGSCFPKDVQALAAMARAHQLDPQILDAVHEVNLRQKSILGQKIVDHFGSDLSRHTITVWGLAFKPRTDDIRDAPALVLIDRLLAHGATLRVHDPEAMDNVRRHYGDRLVYCALPLEALDGADALAIVTEWDEFRHPDFAELAQRMKRRVIFDGRNLYNPGALRAAGFHYVCIGKPPPGGSSGDRPSGKN
jgi:UDPglucose 6-dehydrogenase